MAKIIPMREDLSHMQVVEDDGKVLVEECPILDLENDAECPLDCPFNENLKCTQVSKVSEISHPNIRDKKWTDLFGE